jgi:hypothetical protein
MGTPAGARNNCERWVSGAVGLLFIGIAIAIVYLSAADHPLAALATAAVVGWLGVDALFSAARNRRSMISRIGPLP